MELGLVRFSRVDREMLGKVLGKIGLSAKIINIVRSMYVDTRAKDRLEDIETHWVKSETGVW